ncbi:MAG TPA: YqaJ viral recombinase family protein [Thauera aminoaromatica]|nr:YqaJ viral recombinase family protein [Thauera aminoaromatica]
MKIHELTQGSHEWLAHRSNCFNASDAPAMLGVSPYKTRAQLLRELHTGVSVDVDIATQKRFENGHRAEALARPMAEQIIGEDLYPVVGSEGRLSASFDGLTMDESIAFEHKALNDELRAAFRAIAGGAGQEALPIYHRAQMEQQLMISGAERVLFMSSSFDADGGLLEQHHCWYYPDDEMRGAILQGWVQFAEDLANYTLPPAAEAAPVGKAPETLPALRIEVTGQVTASNLAEFKKTAMATIRSVNRDLKTDQDFADAERAVKWCSDVESRLKAAKEHALSQTASIDALFKALDDIASEARTVRLDLDKLVTRRKTEVKEEAVARARRALDDHIARLNAEIAPFRLPPIAADFAGTIKGLKSVASMQDKLDGLLATTKIAADADARAIRGNVTTFKQEGEGFEFLFADLGQIIHKAADDFRALVAGRIAQHKVAEAERERKRQEAAAAEEARRAQAAAEAAQRQQEAAAQDAQRQAAAALEAAQRQQTAAPAVASAAQPAQEPALSDEKAAAVSNARALMQAVANEPATLKLGVICERLGFTMTAAFLADTLHIKPARADGAAELYTESQYQTICRQLISHIGAMAELYTEAA